MMLPRPATNHWKFLIYFLASRIAMNTAQVIDRNIRVFVHRPPRNCELTNSTIISGRFASTGPQGLPNRQARTLGRDFVRISRRLFVIAKKSGWLESIEFRNQFRGPVEHTDPPFSSIILVTALRSTTACHLYYRKENIGGLDNL